MKGLKLARAYYDAHIDQLLTAVPEADGRIAAGLVGEGSQCFGFDDAISQDHDFAPGFCIWLDDEDFDRFGDKLQRSYDALPKDFCGYSRDNIIARDRLGVIKISDFYRRFTGSVSGIPETLIDWLFTPEHQLAAATDGEIFRDDTGKFTAIRRQLLQFYPEDIRRKKIAARAAVMSQAGQYNLLRCIRRGDNVAALQAMSRFTEAAISMIYLLCRRYTPFYKWSFHGLRIDENDQLDASGASNCESVPARQAQPAAEESLATKLCPLIERLTEVTGLMSRRDFDGAHALAFHLTEEICTAIATELNRQGISTCKSPFLQDHLREIMDGITDPQIRSLPPMADCQN